jgi:hypothetical protein
MADLGEGCATVADHQAVAGDRAGVEPCERADCHAALADGRPGPVARCGGRLMVWGRLPLWRGGRSGSVRAITGSRAVGPDDFSGPTVAEQLTGERNEMTLKHKLITAAAVAVIPLGGGALGLASGSGAGAAVTPLQVTLSADGNGTAAFNSAGDPVLTLGSSGTYAQMKVSQPAGSLVPSTEPSFVTDYYAAGSPRWVIQLANGDELESNQNNRASGWLYDTGSGWVCGNTTGGPGSGTCTYANAVTAVDADGAVAVTSAFIVEDADQAAGTADTLTGVQYNGQYLAPGTVSVTTPANQTSTKGSAIKPLQLAGSTTTSDKALTYTITNLPTGLSATPAGLISGTPTATGSFSVNVNVTDAYNDLPAGAVFTWTVNAATVPPPTVMTIKYVCGRSSSRLVWNVKNVSGAGAAFENNYQRVDRHWSFDGQQKLAPGASYRLITHVGTRAAAAYKTDGSAPPHDRVGAVTISAALPSSHKRCS